MTPKDRTMSLPRLTVHIVPLQIKVNGSSADITCDDPRAKLVEGVLHFQFNPPPPEDPPASRRVCFVVEDLPDAGGYDNYFNISSAPPMERLVPWERIGTTSRSPELPPGHKIEVVVVAYSVPGTGTSPTATVKVGHGRRRFDITDPHSGGNDLF